MQIADRIAFLEIVIGFAELKGKKLSAPALELYWNAMQAWSIDEFRAAANQLVRTREFMPTPKEFEDLRRAGRETPGEVFAHLRQWLIYTPRGYKVRDDTPHPIAVSIRAMGGADAYAMADESKLPFLERRFCEHYERITEAEESREAVPMLAYNSLTPVRKRIAGTLIKAGS